MGIICPTAEAEHPDVIFDSSEHTPYLILCLSEISTATLWSCHHHCYCNSLLGDFPASVRVPSINSEHMSFKMQAR